MKTKLYLDRRGKENPPYPVKIALNLRGSSAYISTGVSVSENEWDAKTGRVVATPMKARYNLILQEKKTLVDRTIEELASEGKLRGLRLSEIRSLVQSKVSLAVGRVGNEAGVVRIVREYASKAKRPATRVAYELTARKIAQFDKRGEELVFEDITKDWLEGFNEWMSGSAPSVNARNIHLRNIRTIFNYAIDDGLTSVYPFRKFKIKAAPTKDRSLRASTLREIFGYDCDEWQTEYRDIFKLIFLLCGINMGDLAMLAEIRNGRIEYQRLKTGQPVSVAVLPEAMEIIDRYRGRTHLLNILDRYRSYKDYLHHLNDALKKIGMHYDSSRKRYDGEAICKDISTYYARYSWATIATELDVPERTIAAALGHSTSSVTDIYMRADMRRKVDAANRRVADFVLYDKQ